MTALHDFLQAAASYFGLPLDQIQGSTLDTAQGDLGLVLRVALKPEDVMGIAARMQRMALERKVDEAQAAELAQRTSSGDPTAAEWRARYNALHPMEKSRFGSYARFRLYGGALPEAPTFPEPAVLPKVELPPHVYLAPDQATEQQKAMAVGRDARGWFAVDPADLTEQQRAAQSGVTSDAGDFGGLPG